MTNDGSIIRRIALAHDRNSPLTSTIRTPIINVPGVPPNRTTIHSQTIVQTMDQITSGRVLRWVNVQLINPMVIGTNAQPIAASIRKARTRFQKPTTTNSSVLSIVQFSFCLTHSSHPRPLTIPYNAFIGNSLRNREDVIFELPILLSE